MEPRSSDNRKPPDALADARFRRAFAELLTGNDYAEMTSGNPWDYAVEIHVLRRFGLSMNDLRLLMQKGFVEHAEEVTTEDSNERMFRPVRGVSFAKRSCFVLTPLGAAKAYRGLLPSEQLDSNWSGTKPTPDEFGMPIWDAARRVLSFDGQTVKQFTRPAVNQELVLSAFEEEGWPPRILDPLVPHLDQASKQRLGETIKSLNRGQVHPLVHFHGDGTGEGILWTSAIETRLFRISQSRVR